MGLSEDIEKERERARQGAGASRRNAILKKVAAAAIRELPPSLVKKVRGRPPKTRHLSSLEFAKSAVKYDEERPAAVEEVTRSLKKSLEDFLYPKMPGAFTVASVRAAKLPWLKERYLAVFAATMGNHSIALYYCVWPEALYAEVLAADPEFQAALQVERGRLVDRATFLSHKSVGLVRNEAGQAPLGAQGAATLAKVVEGLGRGEAATVKKGYRVVVDGMARPPRAGEAPAPQAPE